eukprot:TRINITY_DN10272_c0_g1_i1.p1 TRINITY_DN10272_c0_g1~~TRINITY_DN10272_c0_g1_i1.p1  ORF type:complete len:412 (+),score=80.37 TRINITY_DN10272_c0_g1_i1:88-1323(+)
MAFFLSATLISLAAPVVAKDVQFILDESDGTLTTESAHTSEGSYPPCMEDAYNGQFRHDWAKNKGQAFFEFKFEVSQDGCYSIEEYHPGGANNTACSRYLPSNARLNIEWCKGRTSTLEVDQSRNGAQWNFIGIFPFYAGWTGSVKMSNSIGETCKTTNCFWVVDAFRFTRVATACSAPLEHQLRAEGLPALSTRDARWEPPAMKPEEEWQIGSLHLTVEANPETDPLLELKAQKYLLEASLKTQLGAITLQLTSVQDIALRRLQTSCERRLQATGASFEVSFYVQVPTSGLRVPKDLASQLSTALGEADSDLKVQTAELSFSQVVSGEKAEKGATDEEALLFKVMIGTIAGVCLLAWTTLFIKLKFCKPSKVESDLEGGSKMEEVPDKKDDVDDNASTISPVSERSSDSA